MANRFASLWFDRCRSMMRSFRPLSRGATGSIAESPDFLRCVAVAHKKSTTSWLGPQAAVLLFDSLATRRSECRIRVGRKCLFVC